MSSSAGVGHGIAAQPAVPLRWHGCIGLPAVRPLRGCLPSAACIQLDCCCGPTSAHAPGACPGERDDCVPTHLPALSAASGDGGNITPRNLPSPDLSGEPAVGASGPDETYDPDFTTGPQPNSLHVTEQLRPVMDETIYVLDNERGPAHWMAPAEQPTTPASKATQRNSSRSLNGRSLRQLRSDK